MRAVVISNYALIREGLASIISKFGKMNITLIAETITQAAAAIKENEADIILLDLHENNTEELTRVKEYKEKGLKSRFVILDFNSNKELFIKAIKCGVEGYILGKSSEIEILHSIEQVNRGKKYFDAYFIDSMFNEESKEPQGIEQLTAREREILWEIGRGLSNKAIAEKLYISEHTVKKHINHIFDKLNIRDRTQLALYASSCEKASRSAC